MRQIVLDTETTGLDPKSGHRIIEIGCTELWHYLPTGKVYHAFLNPQRDVPQEATNIHGITTDFLRDKPLFEHVVDDFLAFIGEDQLIIHNAPFDMKFLNAELDRVQKPLLSFERVIDTLVMAKKKFPGAGASLDALCRRFEIDLSGRSYHGALLDTELLAKVYLELIGGKQPAFFENANLHVPLDQTAENATTKERVQRDFPQRLFPLKTEEEAAHTAMVQGLKNALWEKVYSEG